MINRDQSVKKISVLALSAGINSTVLLLNLIANNYTVYPVFINYGQTNAECRIFMINNLLNYLNKKLDLKLELKIINVSGLNEIFELGELHSNLPLVEGIETFEKINKIYYPNKVGFVVNFLKGYSLEKYRIHGKRCNLSYGITKKDPFLYPDTTPVFRKKDFLTFKEGFKNSDYVDFYTPFANTTPIEIFDKGLKYCIQLELDFNEIFSNTTSGYRNYKIKNKWYSEFKSPKALNRINLFTDLNIKDPLLYYDYENQKHIEWKDVKNNAINVNFNHKHSNVKSNIPNGTYERLTQEQILDVMYETGNLYLYNPTYRYFEETDNITSIEFGIAGQKLIVKGVNKEGLPVHFTFGKKYFTNFLDVPLNNNQRDKLNDLYNQALLELKQKNY